MSRTVRRDWKCIFRSGCYGSGNTAVNCQAAVTWITELRNIPLAASPNLQDSCSFSGLLKLIFCLFLLEQTPVKAAGSLLLARFPFLSSVCLFLSALFARNIAHHPPPSSSSICGLGILSLLFWSFQSFHQHPHLWCPSFLLWPPFNTPWGCKFKCAKVNKSSSLPTSFPFSPNLS